MSDSYMAHIDRFVLRDDRTIEDRCEYIYIFESKTMWKLLFLLLQNRSTKKYIFHSFVPFKYVSNIARSTIIDTYALEIFSYIIYLCVREKTKDSRKFAYRKNY